MVRTHPVEVSWIGWKCWKHKLNATQKWIIWPFHNDGWKEGKIIKSKESFDCSSIVIQLIWTKSKRREGNKPYNERIQK